MAADAAGTSQLWLQDPEGGTPRQLTRAPSPGVGWYVWAESGQLLCYEQRQAAGSRLVGVDTGSGQERVLIGVEGAQIDHIPAEIQHADFIVIHDDDEIVQLVLSGKHDRFPYGAFE